jgi:hypothetical protein
MENSSVPQIFGPIKLKCGMVREDGKRFWHYYTRNGVVKQHWVSAEKFDSYYAIQLKLQEKRKQAKIAKYGIRTKVKDPAKNTKEYRQQKNREYRAKNIEHMRFLKNSWRERNREKARAMVRKYFQRYPEKRLETRNRRRAREQTGVATFRDPLMTGLYFMAKRVSRCTGIKWHVDHVLPLRQGGLHIRSNMQLLPSYWNKKKGAKINFKLPDCYTTAA